MREVRYTRLYLALCQSSLLLSSGQVRQHIHICPPDCYLGYNKGGQITRPVAKSSVGAADKANGDRTEVHQRFWLLAHLQEMADHNKNGNHCPTVYDANSSSQTPALLVCISNQSAK